MTITQLLDADFFGHITSHELILGLRERLQALADSPGMSRANFESAYATHDSYVRRVLSCYGAHTEQLDDLASEVWLRAWAKRRLYDAERGSIQKFLAVIAKSALYDSWRKKAGMPATIPIPEGGDEANAMETISTPSHGPETNLRLDLEKILGPDDLKLLTLMEERCSGRQIAQRLGISEKAAESRIIRLRRKVRNYCNIEQEMTRSTRI
jgi:RNA polymerase sigma factor (sigma-70 family)